jgi:hypothetical protein
MGSAGRPWSASGAADSRARSAARAARLRRAALILSDEGMTIEKIAELCGHAGTRVTEQVYRKQLRPILLGGAVAMDRIFEPKVRRSASDEQPEDRDA